MIRTNSTLHSSSSNTVALKASDFKAFHIGKEINLYYPPILVLFGTIGNILSFLVYVQSSYRKRSSSVYILALSVVDSLNLLVGLLQYWILFNFYPTVITRQHCEGMYFVVNFVGNYAHWIIVGFTVDRFIAIHFPLWSRIKLTWKRSVLIVLAIGAVAFLKNLHYVKTTDFVYNPETGAAACAFGLVNKATWVKIYQTFEVAVSSIIPFVIILFLNTFIILRLQQNRRKRSKMTIATKQNAPSVSTTKLAPPTATNPNQKRPKTRGTEKSVNIILIIVSTTFIITTCPLLVFRLYFADVNIRSDARQEALYSLGHHICHKLWYTNNGINFLFYSLCARSFRKDLINLLCLARKNTRNNAGTTRTSDINMTSSTMTKSQTSINTVDTVL